MRRTPKGEVGARDRDWDVMSLEETAEAVSGLTQLKKRRRDGSQVGPAARNVWREGDKSSRKSELQEQTEQQKNILKVERHLKLWETEEK